MALGASFPRQRGAILAAALAWWAAIGPVPGLAQDGAALPAATPDAGSAPAPLNSPSPSPSPSSGADIDNRQLAAQIVEYGYPPEGRLAMFMNVADEVSGQLIAAMPNVMEDPQMRAVVERHAERISAGTRDVLEDHIDNLMEALAIAYAENFTRAELEGLHAFVSSPAGRGFLARSTAVASHPAFVKANQAYLAQYMAKLPRLQDQFMAEVRALLRERE